MLKKVFTAVFSLIAVLCFSTMIFSQDQPASSEQPKVSPTVEDTEAEKAGKVDKPGEVTVKKGRAFFDGYNVYVNSQVQMVLSLTDNMVDGTVYYRIDDKGEFIPYASPFSINEEGVHSVVYYSVDKLANKEKENKALKVIVDNTPPEVLVAANQYTIKDKLYVSPNLQFTVTAKDSSSGIGDIEYSTDGVSYSKYENPFNVPTDKELNLKVKVTDKVGNVQEKFVFRTFDAEGKSTDNPNSVVKLYYDNTPPVAAIKCDKELIVKDGRNIAAASYKYTVDATDEDSGVGKIQVRVDEKGDFQDYKGEISFDTNGEHKIEANVEDRVGNKAIPVIFPVFVDTIPPVSEIKMLTDKE